MPPVIVFMDEALCSWKTYLIKHIRKFIKLFHLKKSIVITKNETLQGDSS